MAYYNTEPKIRNTATNPKVGILLANLGTPDAPTAQALRPYLRQFLWVTPARGRNPTRYLVVYFKLHYFNHTPKKIG